MPSEQVAQLIQANLDAVSVTDDGTITASPRPEKAPPLPPDAPPDEPDDAPTPLDGGTPDEGPDEEGPDEGDADETEGPQAGSQEDPFTIHDFPKDEYIRVKIGGEESVIPVREAIENGMRQRDFDKSKHAIKQLTEQAETLVKEARDGAQRLQQGVLNTLSDPEQLMAYLDAHHPDVLDAIAIHHYPQIYQAHERGMLDQYRTDRQLRQRERLLEAQRRQSEEARERETLQRARDEKTRLLGPALKAAIAETGFQRPSPEILREIGLALDARERYVGRPLAQREIQQVATKWLRIHSDEQPRASRKPRTRGRKPPPEATQGKRRSASNGASLNGGSVPQYDQFGRLNPKWILSQST